MERGTAFHLVRALRLSFDSPDVADELEEFIIDLLEKVELTGEKKPVLRHESETRGLISLDNQPEQTIQLNAIHLNTDWTNEDALDYPDTTKVIPITDE